MSAPDTAPAADLRALESGPLSIAESSVTPPGAEWLLSGGWFTVGLSGAITSWSVPAEEKWGLARHDAIGSPFMERLLTPEARAEHGPAIEAVLGGDGQSFSADLTATGSEGETFRAELAIVTIRTNLGYELNALIQDVVKQTKTVKAVASLRERHATVLARIDAALRGEGAAPAETEAGARLAGALVLFDPNRKASAARVAQPPAVEVASPSPARAVEEGRTRETLDAALRDSLAARTEVTELQAQLEEARREAQRARGDAETANAEAERARTELEAARAELEAVRAELEEARSIEHEVVDADIASDEPGPADEIPSLAPATVQRAITDDMFTLHCQPVLDLGCDEVGQYELLIRMLGEDGRLYLPEAFLGAARRAGLAHEIDRWVVRQGIGLICENELQDRQIRIEVNLSPESIDDAELPTLIEEELAATGIDPASLILEITGATAIADLEGAKKLAKSLRALGCRFALDDFHSTFGSFRYLKELPVDYLKLDGELIGSLAESKTSELIIKALVDVARATATKTVAVFVSDDETLEILRGLGVDFAQGYAVGRPRPAGEVWPSGPAELPAAS